MIGVASLKCTRAASCSSVTSFWKPKLTTDLTSHTRSGEGYNTTADGSKEDATAVKGATSSKQCAVDAGYQMVNPSDPRQGLAPCARGFYKETYGPGVCQQCPSGALPTARGTKPVRTHALGLGRHGIPEFLSWLVA